MTEAVKEPIVRRQFPTIFIFYAEKQVHFYFSELLLLLQCVVALFALFALFIFFGLLLACKRNLAVLVFDFLLEKNSGPKGIDVGQLIPTSNVLIAVSFCLS